MPEDSSELDVSASGVVWSGVRGLPAVVPVAPAVGVWFNLVMRGPSLCRAEFCVGVPGVRGLSVFSAAFSVCGGSVVQRAGRVCWAACADGGLVLLACLALVRLALICSNLDLFRGGGWAVGVLAGHVYVGVWSSGKGYGLVWICVSPWTSP